MTDPYINFDAWFSNAQSAANDSAKFAEYYPTFEFFFASICETGFLPEPICEHTTLFMNKIANPICKTILSKEKPSSVQLPTIKQFLELFLKYSLYGLLSVEKSAVEIAITIIGNKYHRFFDSTTKHSIYGILCRSFITLGGMEIINQKLKDRIFSLDFYCMLTTLISNLYSFDKDFNSDKYIKVTSEKLNEFILAYSYESISVSELTKCIEQIRYALPCNRNTIECFVSNFLPILSKFITAENNFEQRNSALKEIQSLATDKDIQKNVGSYFTKNINLLKEITFHSDYSEAIGDILSVIGHYGYIDAEIIQFIWEKSYYLSSLEKKNFMAMFVRLADFGRDEMLTETISHIFSLEHNMEWFGLLDLLLDKMRNRKECTSHLDKIREFLIDLIFSNEEDSLSGRAKSSLLTMITFGAREETFLQLMNKFSIVNNKNKTDYLLELLNCFFDDQANVKISPPTILECVEKTLNLLIDANPSSALRNFIIHLCRESRIPFSKERLETICDNCNHYDDFFGFLDSLANAGAIVPDHLEMLLNKFQSGEKMFFKLIKHLIYNANGTGAKVTQLPLKQEDIIWNFATTESEHRIQFEKLLCQIYASNDGIVLTDGKMITEFLSKWKMQYDTNPAETLIDILCSFVYTLESQSKDNFEYSHRYESEIVDVVVYWTENPASMKFSVPKSTTLGTIIEKIVIEKNIQLSTPILYVRSFTDPLKRTLKVENYANLEKNGKLVATFDIFYSKSRKLKLHIRNAKPSNDIINSPWIDDLFQKMCNQNETSSLYNLFKLLPRHHKAICFGNQKFSVEETFPYDRICYFLYNFISLLIDIKKYPNIIPKLIDEYHVDEYLIRTIENIVIDNNLSDLSDLKIELVNYFLDFLVLMPQLKDGEKVFVILMRLSLNPLFFQKVKLAASKQIQNAPKSYPFPERFEDLFGLLLLHEDPDIRNFAVERFNSVDIPVHIYIDILSNLGESVSEEFFTSLTSHLSEEIMNYPLLSQVVFKLLYSESAHGNFLLKILTLIHDMIKHMIIDRKEYQHLLEFLTKRFLSFDFHKDDRIAFGIASKCITLISDENVPFLRSILEPFHINRKPFHQYQINGDENISISAFNKMGLKNLGMTCYLNATLQQFYSIKPFRYAAMSYQGDNKLIKELGKLFEDMKFSRTKSVTTKGFIDNYLLWGTNLDPRSQQDAHEFINSFLDNLQGDPYFKDLTENLFHGRIFHKVKGLDTEYEKEMEEPYSILGLEVQQLNGMEESFNNFIKPNYLINENQYWDEVNRKKINAIEHSCISKVPPFLIVQLMRFKFNHDLRQREKISKFFKVNKSLDISNFTFDKNHENSVYDLYGIIIHRGVALGGHYISFVKSKKHGWLCYDDDFVTRLAEDDVFSQASGIETSSTNIAGYILFYRQRKDDMKNDETKNQDLKEIRGNNYVLPISRRKEFDEINEETRMQQLLCSSGYFELMLGLSKLPNSSYTDICVKYSIDTLPFTKIASDCLFFYEVLAKHEISSTFIPYLCDGFLSAALFECPIDTIRKGIVKLIKSSFKSDFDGNTNDDIILPFSQSVFNFVPHCLFSYRNIDQLFNILTYLVKFKSVKEYAEKEWKDSILDLFVNGMSNFLASNPNLKANYIFEGMILTHFLKFVCSLDLGNPGEAFSDNFYLNCCHSNTDPKAIAKFTHKYFSRDMFLAILKSNLLNSNAFKAIALMYHVVPDESFMLATTLEFKLLGFMCKDVDIITLIAAALCKYPEIGDVLMKTCNQWLPRFLTHEDSQTRNNCVVCTMYLVPSETVSKHSYFDLVIPQEKFLLLPEMEIKTRPLDKEINDRASILLTNVLPIQPTLEKLIIENSKSKNKTNVENIACQYLQLVNELAIMSPNQPNLCQISNLYEIICNYDKTLFSEQLQGAITAIRFLNVPIAYENLISALPKKISKNMFFGLCQFLPNFLEVVKRFNVNAEFVSYFMDNIAFAPISRNSKIIFVIKDFIKDFVFKKDPNLLNEMYVDKAKKWETTNITMMIHLCEIINKKRILLQLLAKGFKELMKIGQIDLNELTLIAVKRSLKGAYNKEVVELMCASGKLDEKVKTTLKQLVL